MAACPISLPAPMVMAVNVISSLWASVQGDPIFMRRVNGWLTIFWIVMIPVSIVTGWINSVTYIAVMSLWALVSGHWSAWQAARVEVKQAEMDEKADDATVQAVKEEVREVNKELQDET
jgi:hypothetical protein